MTKEHEDVVSAIAEHAKIELSSVGKMLDKAELPPQVDALVEGPVISIQKSSVYIDLAPFGTGIIYGREFINAKDIIKKINIGDVVKAKVVGTDNDEGYIELSLKEAKQALIWRVDLSLTGKVSQDSFLLLNLRVNTTLA